MRAEGAELATAKAIDAIKALGAAAAIEVTAFAAAIETLRNWAATKEQQGTVTGFMFRRSLTAAEHRQLKQQSQS